MKQFDLDTWEEILVTITRNKTRSLLTAFGIFWGIFMLISLLGGAKGMQETLSLQFKGFATNSGFMGTNQTSKAYRGFQQGRYWDLENKDVERILRNVEGADVVTPTLARWGVNIVYNEQKISGTLKGLYPIYSQIEEPLITQGRYLNDMDVRDNRKVCIIGKQIYESLFPGGENPCGKYIEINGIYYQVIGVNMGTGNVSIQGNTETSVIIPFSTMQNNYNFGQKVQMIAYIARKGYAISEVEKDIARIVKQAHLIHPDDDQALVQLNAEVLFGMMDNLFSGIRILGWMVGLGTLLAGAIGVSNIMMVTSERTYHRNRYPAGNRCTAQRYSPADSFRKYCTDKPCRNERNYLCGLSSEHRRKCHIDSDSTNPFSNQLLAGNRSLHFADHTWTSGRTGTGIPGHGRKTN